MEIQPIQQYSIDRTRLFTTESEGLDSVRTCVSILIPSRGRSAKLANLLDALSDQVLDDNVEIEVIVVIDGDGTPPDVPVSLDVQLHRTVHVGAGAARNIAMSCARGQLLLFLNDDVVPEPRCVMAHVRAHDGQHPMVLGYSPWLQPEQPTWFDAFVQHTPCIFGQIPTHDGALLDWRSAWTLNLSVKASCIASQNARFDECIRPVYFEDIEFAYRLFGHDRAIWYAPEAVALHDHRVTMREYFAREVLLGIMSNVLYEVNQSCHHEIIPCEPAIHAAHAEPMFNLDARDQSRQLSHFVNACNEAVRAAIDDADVVSRAMELYTFHLPLKRRAFRLGLCDAVINPSLPWQDRVARSRQLLDEDQVFSLLPEASSAGHAAGSRYQRNSPATG